MYRWSTEGYMAPNAAGFAVAAVAVAVARPKPSVGMHTHSVDEALTLEEGLLSISLAGTLSSGDTWESEIFLPICKLTIAGIPEFVFELLIDIKYNWADITILHYTP